MSYIGKTRTISASVELLASNNKRVMIVAPSDEACHQLLDVALSRGIMGACLVVSNMHKYKLLDSATRARLAPHVLLRHLDQGYEPEVTDMQAGMWDQVAYRRHGTVRPLPSVIIGTFSDISGAVSRHISAWQCDQLWTTQVASLVHAESIDAVIVEDATQLWAGYALVLLPGFTNVENIILVGNEHLAPNQIRLSSVASGLPSMISAASLCEAIPHTKLSEFYGLLPSMAAFLSSKVYAGSLSVSRCAETQARFDSHMQTDVQPLLRNPIAQALVHRLLATRLNLERPASFAWIHVESPHQSRTGSLSPATSPEVLEHVASVAVDAIWALASRTGYPSSVKISSKLAIVTLCPEVYELPDSVAIYLLICTLSVVPRKHQYTKPRWSVS